MNFQRQRLKLVESQTWRRTRLLREEGELATPGEGPPIDQEDPEAVSPEAIPGEEPASTPEGQAPEPDDAALAITVHATDGVADEFRIAAKNALLAIPAEIRKIVSDHGFSVTIARSMAELESELEGPVHVPLSRLASIVLRASKEIAIAESIKDENEADLPTLNPAGVLRHAFGHAVDELGEQFIKGRSATKFSDLESFKYAHVSDIGRLAQDKKAKLAFYVEDEDAARSECFAECFAALHEGGSTYTIEVMSQFFPAAMKQVKDTITAVKNGTEMTDKDGDGVPDSTHPKGEPQAKSEPSKSEKPAEKPQAEPPAPEPALQATAAPEPPAEEPAEEPSDENPDENPLQEPEPEKGQPEAEPEPDEEAPEDENPLQDPEPEPKAKGK